MNTTDNKMLSFIWRRSKAQIAIVAAYFIVGIAVFVLRKMPFADQWDIWLEAYITSGIIFMAFFIWYNEKKQEWEMSLPKRLTVHFKYQGKYIMSCYEAYLAGPADIRAWSLQIGAQMAKEQLLFYPSILQKKPKLSENKQYFAYETEFFLTNIPKMKTELQTQYMVWIPGQDGTLSEAFRQGHPEAPLSLEEVRQEIQRTS